MGRSTEHAYTALIDYVDRQDDDGTGDIAAFFYTCGLHVGGDTLDWRLKRYADTHFVEPRTALRRSDRGAKKLASLVRDSFDNERPWGILVVLHDKQKQSLITTLSLSIPNGSSARQPHIYINNEHLTGVQFDFKDEGINPLFIESSRTLPPIPLNYETGVDDSFASIKVYWIVSVWPTWMVGCGIHDSRLHTKMEVNRGGFVEIDVMWAVGL